MGDIHIADEALVTLDVPEDCNIKHMTHTVYTYTAGHTEEMIQDGVCNGIDV